MEKYMVNKEIGCGSFGKVFVVESKLTGIEYVAKQIDLTKLSKRQKCLAEKEIEVLSKLKHPNIVRYKEAYSDEKHLHIVMELCELGDLHGLIQEMRVRNDRLSDPEVMDYFVHVCLALEYIHNQRILHRDLKTKNIFLKKGNLVKLGDFGVAKVLENSFELARTCIGSPFYISPEMCENRPYDKKSDVWALGCVLFELASLRYAFTATNMKLLITKITTGEHAPLSPSVNPKIRQLIKKLFSQNPKNRPTVTEILATPYVTEFRDRLSCKNRVSVAKVPHRRTQSGEDLRQKTPIQNNLRCKSGRTELPISKSSLNLNTTDITEPQAKYKTTNTKTRLRRPNFWKNLCDSPKAGRPVYQAINHEVEDISKRNLAKKNNCEQPKTKKLPRTDSLYYTLIEENNLKKTDKAKSVSIIRNIFEKSYHSLQNQEEETVETENVERDYEKNNTYCGKGEIGNETCIFQGDEKSNVQFPGSTAAQNPENHDEDNKQRKRWETTTADRDQLISLLNETELINSQPTSYFKRPTVERQFEKGSSIEDLLFTETTDLSHIAVLMPQQVFQNRAELTERQVTSLDTQLTQHTSRDTLNNTDVMQQLTGLDILHDRDGSQTYTAPFSKVTKEESLGTSRENEEICYSYEHLEQRRLQLEQSLGLSHFLNAYKTIEQVFCKNCDPNKVPNDLEGLTQDLGLDTSHINEVWQLVRDDNIYKSQL